jgi:hypothetical protein
MLFAISKPLPPSTMRSLVKSAIRVPSNDSIITMKLTGILDYNNHELHSRRTGIQFPAKEEVLLCNTTPI